MSDDRSPGTRRVAVRSIIAAIMMLSAPIALMQTAQARNYARIQPSPSYWPVPIGHRKPTRDDVKTADPVQSETKNIEKDNELLERPPTQEPVVGADAVQSEENALAKTIEQENDRLDHLLRGICRGC